PPSTRSGGWRMRGNKAGLADLKRLQQSARQARAQAEKAAAPARPADEPVFDPAAFRRAMHAVTPLKQSGRRAPPAPQPASSSTAVAMRRAAAVGESAARADAGVSDGGEVAHLLSEGGTAFVRADAAP